MIPARKVERLLQLSRAFPEQPLPVPPWILAMNSGGSPPVNLSLISISLTEILSLSLSHFLSLPHNRSLSLPFGVT